jgi:hypothetical protein
MLRLFVMAGTLALVGCGYSREHVKGEVQRAAESCVRVGEPLTDEVRECLRRSGVRDSRAGPKFPMLRCLDARGTIGQFCGYLDIELDTQGGVSRWRVSTNQEE